MARRSKAALIPYAAGQARFLQQGAQPVGDPHTALQPIGKGGTAQRDDHKFLDIDIIGGVAAAIQNIHHGAGQSGPPPRKAGEVLPQRQAAGSRGGVGHGQADPQNGIGAEVRFISGAIRFAEDAVNGFLLGGIPPDEGPGQFVINGADGGAHPFSAVTGWVAVPFFTGLVPAGGSAAGDGCDAYGTALQGDLHPDGRVAAAIQDFEALYFGNGGMGHGFLLLVLRGRRDGAAAGQTALRAVSAGSARWFRRSRNGLRPRPGPCWGRDRDAVPQAYPPQKFLFTDSLQILGRIYAAKCVTIQAESGASVLQIV